MHFFRAKNELLFSVIRTLIIRYNDFFFYLARLYFTAL